MNNSPADIIRRLLIDLGLGSESGDWAVFVSFLPDNPNNAICIYDTAGTIDGRIMATGEQVEHPGIQIRVRGPIYPVTWHKAISIARKLDEQRRTTVAMSSEESYTLHNISRSGALLPAGIEEDGDRRRHNFTINAVLTIEETE